MIVKMKYHIEIRVCKGSINTNKGKVSLFLDEYELDETFFQMTMGELIVTTDLKNSLLDKFSLDCSFEKIETVELRDDFEVTFETPNGLELWLLKTDSTSNCKDLIWWDNKYLVVSQAILDFLILNNGFRDAHAGGKFGKEWEILANRYYLTQPIDKYFDDNYLKDKSFLEEKLKLMTNENRKRKGLDPL